LKKKVLIISGSLHQIPAPPKGTGVARLLQRIANDLDEFDVYALSFKKEAFTNHDERKFIQIDPSSFKYRFYYQLILLIPLWLNKKLWGKDNARFIAYYLCFGSVLRKVKPHIVLTSMHLDAFRLAYLQYPKAKHIFYFRSSDIYLEGFKKLEFLARNATRIFTLTQESSDFLIQKFPFLKLKIEVISNAVDLDIFNANKGSLNRLVNRGLYGISQSDFVLGYAGRLTLSKGLDQILECLIKLQEKYKNIKLLIAGSQVNDTVPDVTYHDRIERLLQKVEPGRIVFTGWLDREKMINFYSCIDVGLLLSKQREGHSMFGLECQACGVPVIATTVGGNPEIIVHNKSGFLLSKGKEAEELESYILQLYNNTSLLHAMQVQAVENIKTNFTYDLLLSRITKVLKAL